MIDWFLSLNPILAIFILALVYTLIVVAIYSLFADVEELREIKKEMDELRKKLVNTKNENELKKLQTKTLELSLLYNQKSMKTFIFTTLPAIFIFGFLTGHYTYEPLKVDQPFNITIQLATPRNITITQLMTSPDFKLLSTKKVGDKIIYTILPKKEGYFEFKFKIEDKDQRMNKTYSIPFIVTKLYKTTPDVKKVNDGIVEEIRIEYKPLRLVPFKVFGYSPGRLTFYILFSLILNTIFRKLFNLP